MRSDAEAGRRPPDPAFVRGSWEVPITVDPPRHTVDDAVSVDAVAFGPGTIVVDEVAVDVSGTIILGRIEGFSTEAIPDIVLAPAFLVAPDGVRLRLLSGRSGFGEGRKRFEFRFERVSGSGYHLEIPFHVAGVSVPGTAMNSVAAGALAAHAGTIARVPIDLPD